jgi:hypothetical protein
MQIKTYIAEALQDVIEQNKMQKSQEENPYYHALVCYWDYISKKCSDL